jgi:hypothetical protein
MARHPKTVFPLHVGVPSKAKAINVAIAVEDDSLNRELRARMPQESTSPAVVRDDGAVGRQEENDRGCE